MPIFTFPIPNNDPKYSFPNKFGVPDNIYSAIINETTSADELIVIDDGDYTVTDTDTHILYERLTADRTLTLPDPSLNTNRILSIKHGGDGAFDILLSVSIRESFSTTTSSIGQNDWVEIISSGGEWWITKN